MLGPLALFHFDFHSSENGKKLKTFKFIKVASITDLGPASIRKPASLGIFGLGAIGLLARRRKKA
jgi:hypothetical protein